MGEIDVDELAREMRAYADRNDVVFNHCMELQRPDILAILTDRDALKARVEELRLQLDLLADAADDLAHTTNCSMIDERIKTARAVLTPKEPSPPASEHGVNPRR